MRFIIVFKELKKAFDSVLESKNHGKECMHFCTGIKTYKENFIKQIYKGTEIQIFDNVLTKIVKIKYCNIFYETKQIEGYRQDLVKKRTNKNR